MKDLTPEELNELRIELVEFLGSRSQYWKRSKVEQVFDMLQRRDAAIACLREGLEADRQIFAFLCSDPCWVTEASCGPHKAAERVKATLARAAEILKGEK